MYDLLFDKYDDSLVKELVKYYIVVIYFVFVCVKMMCIYYMDFECGLWIIKFKNWWGFFR